MGQVAREGSKKTVFVNFKDVCKRMHRTMEHVMSYFNAELAVSDENNMQKTSRSVLILCHRLLALWIPRVGSRSRADSPPSRSSRW